MSVYGTYILDILTKLNLFHIDIINWQESPFRIKGSQNTVYSKGKGNKKNHMFPKDTCVGFLSLIGMLAAGLHCFYLVACFCFLPFLFGSSIYYTVLYCISVYGMKLQLLHAPTITFYLPTVDTAHTSVCLGVYMVYTVYIILDSVRSRKHFLLVFVDTLISFQIS